MSQDELRHLSHSERVDHAAELIIAAGFGHFFANEQVTEWSGFQAESQAFSFFLTEVRQRLVDHGMWLSGEGQEGKGFFVVRPSENAVVASRFTGKARRALLIMQILLERTPLSELTEAEKRRHDKELRELRYTNRLWERKGDVLKLVRKHDPDLLKDEGES